MKVSFQKKIRGVPSGNGERLCRDVAYASTCLQTTAVGVGFLGSDGRGYGRLVSGTGEALGIPTLPTEEQGVPVHVQAGGTAGKDPWAAQIQVSDRGDTMFVPDGLPE